MSYPIKSSPSERTGDRLLIRCLEFSPPKDGAGLSVTLINAYKTDNATDKQSILSMKDRERMDPSNNDRLEVMGIVNGKEKLLTGHF